jgi:hemolysin-activating ACP:hemolysin acyltransferase|tara:strand:+ start:778 stop:1191 length:414 start_codon:yes stop_codon:yes gene_type:complete
MDDLLDIIALYKDYYDQWSGESLKDIYAHIYPPITLNQYSIHRDEDGIYGFTNWAFLDEETEQKFLDERSLDLNDWNTGENTWVIDTIFTKEHNAMKFNKTFFTHLLGPGKTVQWLRLAPNGLIRNHFKVITKEAWL